MKWTILVYLGVLTLSLTARAETRPTDPVLVGVYLDHAYVPVGFDDNDRVQVVVRGILPNPCYKVGPYQIRKDAGMIRIQQTAYRYQGICPQVVVPFTQVVELGLVRAGHYLLQDAVGGGRLGQLPVNRAVTPNPDDFLYAPLTDAYVERESGVNWIAIKGTFTNRCMRLKEIRVGYHGDVVVVQPVAEMIQPERSCDTGLFRFSYRARLRDGLNGTWLVHVRSMDGQSINKLTEF